MRVRERMARAREWTSGVAQRRELRRRGRKVASSGAGEARRACRAVTSGSGATAVAWEVVGVADIVFPASWRRRRSESASELFLSLRPSLRITAHHLRPFPTPTCCSRKPLSLARMPGTTSEDAPAPGGSTSAFDVAGSSSLTPPLPAQRDTPLPSLPSEIVARIFLAAIPPFTGARRSRSAVPRSPATWHFCRRVGQTGRNRSSRVTSYSRT